MSASRQKHRFDGQITTAHATEIPRLIDVDKRASRLFETTDLLEGDALYDHVPAEVFATSIESGHVHVVRDDDDIAVGFSLTSERGKSLYLDQVSVDPDQGQQGIGRRLVEHVIEQAKARKKKNVALSTFRNVPWNGPFYRSCGFKEIPRHKLEDWMLELERLQAMDMDVTKRCFMSRRIAWL